MNNLVKIMKSGVKFNKENAHICNNLYHTKYDNIVPITIAGISLFDACDLLKLELSKSTLNKLVKIKDGEAIPLFAIGAHSQLYAVKLTVPEQEIFEKLQDQEIKLNIVKQELENKVGDLLKQKRNTESTITKLKQQFKSKKD